jgi:hypothetical protein
MKRELVKFGGVALTVVVGLSAISSLAQQKQPAPDHDVIIEHERVLQVQDGPLPPPPPGDFIFLATEMSFGGKLVKGAPYSAQAVTESTQTLSDGNRIVNKSTAAVYRDSEGRTRREQTLRSIGPFAKSGESQQAIFINDPVAGTSYTLDPRAHVARKMPPMRFKFEQKLPPPEVGKLEGGPEGAGQFRIEFSPGAPMDKKVVEAGVARGWIGTRNGNASTESLGKQNIEGVEAEGTRTTVTIPAGEIGNERPIEIVNEHWYSPELQTIVMTRHSDPRFGENTYRLTNISRTEPPQSLFEVPADYTVKEAPKPPADSMRMRKPANNPE